MIVAAVAVVAVVAASTAVLQTAPILVATVAATRRPMLLDRTAVMRRSPPDVIAEVPALAAAADAAPRLRSSTVAVVRITPEVGPAGTYPRSLGDRHRHHEHCACERHSVCLHLLRLLACGPS